MRYIYVSKKGGKPLNIGVNKAKRIARSADGRDQALVLKILGAGLPHQHEHHQQLVLSRHRYYHEQYQEFAHSQSRLRVVCEDCNGTGGAATLDACPTCKGYGDIVYSTDSGEGVKGA